MNAKNKPPARSGRSKARPAHRVSRLAGHPGDLSEYFDRVVVINLKQRPDRREQFAQALRQSQWPFHPPQVFKAIDGRVLSPPAGWGYGRGAWGCLESHRRVLQRAATDGIQRLLVLEDDVCFADNFRSEIQQFLRSVPADWDQLMIGGQHWGKTRPVRPGVVRCTDCERTHCYAIRGEFMRELANRWQGGGKFGGNGHCDWIMGRDPEMQSAHKVYAPEFFLAGQERSRSDVSNVLMPRKFWNPPGPGRPVVNLHAPPGVAQALGRQGFYLGVERERRDGKKATLAQLFKETVDNPGARRQALREWIKVAQWELAADPAYICTIWHPEATPELVRAASPWKVYEITARTTGEVMAQLPPRLRQAMSYWQSNK